MILLNKNKSGIFLMELIIVMLFFSAASAICIKIFFAGESISQKSRFLTNASINTQSVAQCLKNSGGNFDVLENEYPYIEFTGDDSAVLFYDGDFQHCSRGDSQKYMIGVSRGIEENGVLSFDITAQSLEKGPLSSKASDSGKDYIYHLEAKSFSSEEVK